MHFFVLYFYWENLIYQIVKFHIVLHVNSEDSLGMG